MSNIVDKNLLLNKLKEISIQKKTINNFESIIKKQNLKLETNNNFPSLSITIPPYVNKDIEQPAPVIIETAPVIEQPAPVIEQPVIIETAPVIIETAPVQQPVIEQPAIEQPVIEQPAPVIEQPAPVIEQPAIEQPAPVIEQPVQQPVIIENILPTINEINISDISSIEILNEDIENIDFKKILDIIQSIKEPISILEKYLKTNNIPVDINIEEINNYINIYNNISKISNMEDITNITTQIQKTGCFQRLKNRFFKNIDEKTHQNIKEKRACFTFLFSNK